MWNFVLLLRQLLLTLNGEMRIRVSGLRAGLPASDCDQVISSADITVAGVVHVAEIARTQGQLHVLLLARLQMHALEAAESLERCASHFRKADVEFDNFVAAAL